MANSEPPDLDKMYRMAADSQRRALIAVLANSREETTIDEVVARVGARERGDAALEIELIHSHLPMLQEAGFVTFDRNRGTIRPQERIESFEQILPTEELMNADVVRGDS
jgi:DNA-binding transcriptional ArsR family regulator